MQTGYVRAVESSCTCELLMCTCEHDDLNGAVSALRLAFLLPPSAPQGCLYIPFHLPFDTILSTRFEMQDRTVYVAVWAGDCVQDINMHPPYNLCLRLLFELTSNILVLPTVKDLDTFDPQALPCNTGTGYSVKCAVKRHAASNTLVVVRFRPRAGHALSINAVVAFVCMCACFVLNRVMKLN